MYNHHYQCQDYNLTVCNLELYNYLIMSRWNKFLVLNNYEFYPFWNIKFKAFRKHILYPHITNIKYDIVWLNNVLSVYNFKIRRKKLNKIKVEGDTSIMCRTSSRNFIDLSLIGFIFTKLDNFLSQLIRIQQFVDYGFESWTGFTLYLFGQSL